MATQLAGLGAAISDAFRLAFEAVDRFPVNVTTWLRSRHLPQPEQFTEDGPEVAWCRTCWVEWPCDEFQKLDAELAELTNAE